MMMEQPEILQMRNKPPPPVTITTLLLQYNLKCKINVVGVVCYEEEEEENIYKSSRTLVMKPGPTRKE